MHNLNHDMMNWSLSSWVWEKVKTQIAPIYFALCVHWVGHRRVASLLVCKRGFTWRDTQAVMRTMCIRGHEIRLIWARHKDHSCDSQKWVPVQTLPRLTASQCCHFVGISHKSVGKMSLRGSFCGRKNPWEFQIYKNHWKFLFWR